MIYDCFTYFGGPHEDALVRLRMEELKIFNVIHVAVEADHTFSGNPKPFLFPFAGDNIRYIQVTDMPNNGNPWDNERHQRNSILRALGDAEGEDVIIISDVDEIVKASSVGQYILDGSVIHSIVMDQMYFYVNALASRQSWKHPKILRFDNMNAQPDEIRNVGTAFGLLDGGHHFSYLGGPDTIFNKMKAFSHQEEEIQKMANPILIGGKITRLEQMFNSGKMEIVNELPEHYIQIMENYVY